MYDSLKNCLKYPSVFYHGGILTDQMYKHLNRDGSYARSMHIDRSDLGFLKRGINWKKILPELREYHGAEGIIPDDYRIEKGRGMTYFVSPKWSKSIKKWNEDRRSPYYSVRSSKEKTDSRLNNPGERPWSHPDGPRDRFSSPMFTETPTIYTGIGLFGEYDGRWNFIEPKDNNQVGDLKLALSSAVTFSIDKELWKGSRKKLIKLFDAGRYLRGFIGYLKARMLRKDEMVPPIVMTDFPELSEIKEKLYVTAITSRPENLLVARLCIPETLNFILSQEELLNKATSLAEKISARYHRLGEIEKKGLLEEEREHLETLEQKLESKISSLEAELIDTLEEMRSCLHARQFTGLTFF